VLAALETAALETSQCPRRDAATVTPRDLQSREARVWLVCLFFSKDNSKFILMSKNVLTILTRFERRPALAMAPLMWNALL